MTACIILLPEGAAKADAGLPPTIVVPTVPIAIIRAVVAIIRAIVVPTVPIAIVRSVVMVSITVPIPPIIDFLHLAGTVALGKRQNAGLRGSGSGCVDHQDDDKRES
jgi:hypothetical protein